jgi:hypothetical protein
MWEEGRRRNGAGGGGDDDGEERENLPSPPFPKHRIAETFVFTSSRDHLVTKTFFIHLYSSAPVLHNIFHHLFSLTVWFLSVG